METSLGPRKFIPSSSRWQPTISSKLLKRLHLSSHPPTYLPHGIRDPGSWGVAAGTWYPPSPPETRDPPVWRDATLGGGVKGKLASLVVGDDPGHLLRVRRGLPIWGGSRVPGGIGGSGALGDRWR